MLQNLIPENITNPISLLALIVILFFGLMKFLASRLLNKEDDKIKIIKTISNYALFVSVCVMAFSLFLAYRHDDRNSRYPVSQEIIREDKVGGDKVGGDKVGGDKVGGDKVGGDKVGGDKSR
jgi:hypothetical protein